MSDNSGLGKRIKENYEFRARHYLPRRTHTIIRLDGKAFHSYVKGLDKPFDEGLIEDMQLTTAYLCENIQGCKFGYTQSDEISLLLTDFDKLETSAWFDGNIQKITSISASMAAAKFNQLRMLRKTSVVETSQPQGPHEINSIKALTDYEIEGFKLAVFDSRTFTIPEKDEVLNYFLWRQRDAEKNSVAMLAQSLYSHSELHKKNGSDMQEMCFQKGHNWNNLDASKKRGSFIMKRRYVNGILDSETQINEENANQFTTRHKWEVVEDTPFFGKDREQILKLF